MSNTRYPSSFAGHHTGTHRKLSATSQDLSEPFETRPGPPGTRFCEVRWLASVDSTNRYLIDEAAKGAREGLVAVADHQSAGRGRLGRRWEAPAGENLLASILLEPSLPPDQLHLTTMAVALAAADACSEVAGVTAGLKWPNDLLVGDRKLAGILAERAGSAVVIGLGLNVRWPAPEQVRGAPALPPELEGTATSLWRESDVDPERLDPLVILDVTLGSLEHRLADLSHADERRRQAAEYRERCTTLGRRVRVVLFEETFEAIALDVTDAGHLLVDTGGGLRTVTAGDVVHLA